MPRSSHQLRSDAERIWHAGVAAVAPGQLIRQQIRIDGDFLVVADDRIDMRNVGRIAIVGAGKAAGAMAAALEEVLGADLLDEKHVTGLVSVPSDCIVPTQRVKLVPGRPPGINEPCLAGVAATRRILEIVGELRPNDLCLCVITGGGSALLPAPVHGISLEEKVRLTKLLSGVGANIEQLNIVRRELSVVKGGGLARACRAGRLVSLIISDILGDPLDLIASGPTVDRVPEPEAALAVIESLGLVHEPDLAGVVELLKSKSQAEDRANAKHTADGPSSQSKERHSRSATVTNIILANNATAVDAAGGEAERLGYSHAMLCATASEGPAEEVGRHLAAMALRMRSEDGPDCLITGGEPTVKLIEPSRRGRGGRNQQLALAALIEMGNCRGLALLSGGTDGEDGPTDAAGAIVTEEVVAQARAQRLDPHDFLSRNDAYGYFEAAGGLFKTGPTQTNVCDLRVVTVARG